MKLLLRLSLIALLFVGVVGGVALTGGLNSGRVQAATTRPPAQSPIMVLAQGGVCSCSANTLDCEDFSNREEAQSCFDQCLGEAGYDVHNMDGDNDGEACEVPGTSPSFEPITESSSPASQLAPASPDIPADNNQIYNGNFEYGFYQVPQLGFEPGDVGNVPFYWGWYKSNTHGKVNIYNHQGFGIVCPDDRNAALAFELQPVQPRDPADDMFGPIPGVNPFERPNNSLSLHLQSTDEPDMRLGVYQTVNVIPGRDYRFTMSGTIQVQVGGTTLQTDDPEAPLEAQNHTIEVSFDPTGGTNWQAIPLEQRHVVQFEEEELEFKISGPDDPDLATIQNFETVVRARTDKLTVFITGWRKWANWRSAIFTVDCINLEPLGASRAVLAAPAAPITPTISAAGEAQPAAALKPSAVEPETESQPTEVQIIPPSGGILERSGGSLLTVIVSVVVLGGLVGAGIWNIRRR